MDSKSLIVQKVEFDIIWGYKSWNWIPLVLSALKYENWSSNTVIFRLEAALWIWSSKLDWGKMKESLILINVLSSDVRIDFLMNSEDDFRHKIDFINFFESPEDILVILNLKFSLVVTYQILGEGDFIFDFLLFY